MKFCFVGLTIFFLSELQHFVSGIRATRHHRPTVLGFAGNYQNDIATNLGKRQETWTNSLDAGGEDVNTKNLANGKHKKTQGQSQTKLVTNATSPATTSIDGLHVMQEFLASDKAKELALKALKVAGHASDWWPHPVLLIATYVKASIETSQLVQAATQDIHATLWRDINEATVPRVCSADSDCHLEETCLAHGICGPVIGAIASLEQEIKRQYMLYGKLRQTCTSRDHSAKVLDLVRTGNTFDDLHSREPENGTCARKRLELRRELKDLHDWATKYMRAMNPSRNVSGKMGLTHGSLTRRDYKDIWFAISPSVGEDVVKRDCIAHTDCNKYRFCSTQKICTNLEICDSSIAIDGHCPKDTPPSTKAVCEQGRSERGCCWSTCGMHGSLRSCGDVLGAKLTRLHPLHENHEGRQEKRCGFMSSRRECCIGESTVRSDTSGIDVNPFCCPNNDCTFAVDKVVKMDNEDLERFEGDVDNDAWLTIAAENRTAQEANPKYGVIRDRRYDAESAYAMIKRRAVAIDAEFSRLEQSCPFSLAHVFRRRKDAPGTMKGEDLMDAAEAARCIESHSRKESMTNWAAMHILEYVLPVQAKWATVMCPAILTKLQQQMRDLRRGPSGIVELDKFKRFASTLKIPINRWQALSQKYAINKAWEYFHKYKIVQTHMEWEDQCQEWQAISLKDLNVTVAWEATKHKLVVATKDELLETSIHKREWRFLKALLNHIPPLLVLNGWRDKQSKVTKGWMSSGMHVWAESAAWLAKEGSQLYQNSMLLNGDRIKSFCIDTAMHFAGLRREVPM